MNFAHSVSFTGVSSIMKILLMISFLLPYSLAKVEMVIGVWRHGDRAPKELTYPKDKHDESAWPRGWNQLTNLGMQQTYELGQFLRSRYSGKGKLFGPSFNRSEVFLRSTELERALESAQCVAAGLFPPNPQQIWNQSIFWQPIPVHGNGFGEDDLLLKPTSVKCPAYEQIVEQQNQLLQKQVTEKYKELFKLLSNFTGMNITFKNVKRLYNMEREIIHNLTQPAWLYESWNGTKILDHIRELRRIVRLSNFNSKEKAKFLGGYLLNDFLEKLESAAKGKTSYKAVLYSSHDGTLLALTYAMNVSNDLLVPYASCVLAELHEDKGNYTVQLFYRNSTAEPIRLKLKQCDVNCPINSFIDLLRPATISSFTQFKQLCASSFPKLQPSDSHCHSIKNNLIAMKHNQ